MSPWPFVVAAYALAMVATALLIAWAWRSARRAEAALDKLTRR